MFFCFWIWSLHIMIFYSNENLNQHTHTHSHKHIHIHICLSSRAKKEWKSDYEFNKTNDVWSMEVWLPAPCRKLGNIDKQTNRPTDQPTKQPTTNRPKTNQQTNRPTDRSGLMIFERPAASELKTKELVKKLRKMWVYRDALKYKKIIVCIHLLTIHKLTW